MLLRALPGVQRDTLLRTLQQVHSGAVNIPQAGRTNQEVYNDYIRWANESARALRFVVRPADVEHLVLTKRYWALQAAGGSEVLVGTRHLLNAEIDERAAELAEVENAVKAEMERWSRPGRLVVADTTLYCEHDTKLEQLDLAAIVGAGDEPVHLLLPMAVVDELDNLKQSKDRRLRWRARYTLAVVDRLLHDPTAPATLRERNAAEGQGRQTVEIVFDPPGHRRLEIMDDEIIDRALVVQSLAVGEVTLVTFDTGQSTRARGQGVQVVKLDQLPEGDEPTRND